MKVPIFWIFHGKETFVALGIITLLLIGIVLFVAANARGVDTARSLGCSTSFAWLTWWKIVFVLVLVFVLGFSLAFIIT
jgi:hypothetical protein